VIGQGRLIAAEPLTEFAGRGARASVSVRTADPGSLTALLTGEGASVQPAGGGRLAVTGLTADQISQLAYHHQILLNELTTRTPSLEDAFMELTADHADYIPGKTR
jgi:ABC-2 type transport system ATP-binding protein